MLGPSAFIELEVLHPEVKPQDERFGEDARGLDVRGRRAVPGHTNEQRVNFVAGAVARVERGPRGDDPPVPHPRSRPVAVVGLVFENPDHGPALPVDVDPRAETAAALLKQLGIDLVSHHRDPPTGAQVVLVDEPPFGEREAVHGQRPLIDAHQPHPLLPALELGPGDQARLGGDVHPLQRGQLGHRIAVSPRQRARGPIPLLTGRLGAMKADGVRLIDALTEPQQRLFGALQ